MEILHFLSPVDVLVGMIALQFTSSQVRCPYNRTKLVTASMLSPAIKKELAIALFSHVWM